MIVISGEDIPQVGSGRSERNLYFHSVDDGDVYISSTIRPPKCSSDLVPGVVVLYSQEERSLPPPTASVEILVTIEMETRHSRGWLRSRNCDQSHDIMIAPVQEDLFSRTRGIYETDTLVGSRVLVIGLGSGGSAIALELAKAGVGRFILLDFERLELENVVRHSCGISDIGRFKTRAVRDSILSKNPFAQVEVQEVRVDWGCIELLRQLIDASDLVFCCTDNRESRTLINMIAVGAGRTCIYGGTFTRAYGGHVLRVIPNSTPCYQCFIDMMPEEASDHEISSPDDAERLAYADRSIPVEPGLASDIAPIALMCVKVGILELLRGQPTTLASLYEDLSSCWFQWLNRREQGTGYSRLPALETDPDGLRILAWYGVEFNRNDACPACGDFVQAVLGDRSLEEKALEAFEGQSGESSAEFPPVSE